MFFLVFFFRLFLLLPGLRIFLKAYGPEKSWSFVCTSNKSLRSGRYVEGESWGTQQVHIHLSWSSTKLPSKGTESANMSQCDIQYDNKSGQRFSQGLRGLRQWKFRKEKNWWVGQRLLRKLCGKMGFRVDTSRRCGVSYAHGPARGGLRMGQMGTKIHGTETQSCCNSSSFS